MATLTETSSSLTQLFVHLENTSNSPPARQTTRPRNDWTITPPPAQWSYLCHPRLKAVQDEVDGYFLKNWKFPSFKAVRTFLEAKFSEVTCLYFPLARVDCIQFACRLLTVLFLIDDVLEHMSFTDGEAYNNRLIPISRGDVLPDRTKPEEFILYDLWESMRAHDKELADEVLEPTFVFMRAQTDRARLTIQELGRYLEYREKDGGVSDWTQGGSLPLFSCEGSGGGDRAWYSRNEARALEWETVHDEIVAEKIASPDGCSEAAKAYMKGLEYQMSGNEQWSKTTRRYN
ncbi:unnamed protein product [Penicillium glandicola]